MDKLKHQPSNGSNYKTSKQNIATNEIPIIKPSSTTKTVDIEFLHKIIFDINSKLDSNVYWLTTLLQNIILSIETLNSKAASLDKRLAIIENSKMNEKLIKRDDNFKQINSINTDIYEDNNDDDDEDCTNEMKNKVVLRRRTTIQIANHDKTMNSAIINSDFNRNNRLSQPGVLNNTENKQSRYSMPHSTVQMVKTNNKIKPMTTPRRSLSPIEAFKTNNDNDKNIINFNDLPIIDYKNSSSTNSGTSAKASDIIDNNTQKNSSSANSKTEIKATDTDQDSLDNFIDLVVESSDSELLNNNNNNNKLGINFDTNEILKIINKSSKEDVMNINNKNNSENRIIKRFKILKDGPFEFVLDIVDGNLVVMEIFDGGIIQRHGGVKVGDYLMAANGLKLSGKTFDEAQLRLEKAMEDDSQYIELILTRSSEQDDEEITAL